MNKIVRSFNYVIPLFFWILCTISYAQNPLLELSFTAVNITQYQQLDSIKIKNLTLGCDTALYYPDTTLVLDYISNILESGESIENHFFLGQNFPNPFKNETHVKLYLPVEENIVIRISDVLGRQIANYKRSLQSGLHSFTFYPAKERNYLLSVSGNYATKTIKMLAIGAGSNTACKIEYDGLEEKTKPFKSGKAQNTFVFNDGDELVYIGNADGVESAILGSPTVNQLIEFQFATKIPCPGTPTITYGGQIYNTIQVLSQCWLKENLNFETANSWCYNNSNAHCDTYGRFYLWEATLTVCPDGWHLPSDEEWKILEGAVDSQFGMQNPEWELIGGWRGFDAGYNLKTETGWQGNGNGVNIFDFSAKPGGYRFTNGNFFGLTSEAGYWTSTELDQESAWQRFIAFNREGIYRYNFDKQFGLFVRCLKDQAND